MLEKGWKWGLIVLFCTEKASPKASNGNVGPPLASPCCAQPVHLEKNLGGTVGATCPVLGEAAQIADSSVVAENFSVFAAAAKSVRETADSTGPVLDETVKIAVSTAAAEILVFFLLR